jgi:hypothetical protein
LLIDAALCGEYSGALFLQTCGDGGADAAAASGYQRYFSAKSFQLAFPSSQSHYSFINSVIYQQRLLLANGLATIHFNQ